MVERDTGVAVWRQIGESLAEDIRARRYPPGAQLPTENALATHYAVNRHTVRRAIGELAQHGLVRIERGRGTFVESSALRYALGKRTRFTETLRQHGMHGQTTVIDSAMLTDATIARHLGLTRQAKLLYVRICRHAEKNPVSVSDNYFDARRFPGFVDALRETASVSVAFERHGVDDYIRLWSRITARLPEADIARLLDQPKMRPILQVEALNADLQGAPLQYTIARLAGDGVELMVSNEDV
ncbi:GntR family phosphonate transport system transcriptional regulator [Robbsia andropogonis]|uniref:phosphonate metabolism transcriptional regulator PhnF n=1 Tax=Robbsia andropogonis TaxID=28092 RepID=UPI003D1B6C12